MEKKQQVDDEIVLIDILLILWKRKIMIFSMTLLLIVVAGTVSMILPRIYNITAIIELGRGADGVPVVRPEEIKETIVSGVYDAQLKIAFNLSADKFPNWQVHILQNPSLLKVSVGSDNPDRTVQILNKLLTLVSERIDKRVQEEKRILENNVKLKEIKKKWMLEQIKLLRAQLLDTTEKFEGLEKAGNRIKLASRLSEAKSVLRYSDQVRRQQQYLNKLQLKLKKTEEKFDAAAIVIDNAQIKYEKIKHTIIRKSPTVPNRPVKPRKILILSLALVFGLMFSILMAFLVEYIQRAGKNS